MKKSLGNGTTLAMYSIGPEKFRGTPGSLNMGVLVTSAMPIEPNSVSTVVLLTVQHSEGACLYQISLQSR